MRGTKQKAARSSLAGKLYDETGDRLTPSHSRENGRRLRYYISHRLVTGRSGTHPDAWRLPTDQVEGLLVELVRHKLGRPNAVASIAQGISAAEILSVSGKLDGLKEGSECLALAERVDLRPGSLTFLLDRRAVARFTGCRPDQINTDGLTIEAPFRMRRRGVELKLHLGDAPSEIDQTLIRNIDKARRWLVIIVEGRTFAEIAQTEGTSKRRVQDIVELGILAPELLNAIVKGEQPAGLTSDYLIKTGFPAIWSEQRRQFAALRARNPTDLPNSYRRNRKQRLRPEIARFGALVHVSL